MSALLDEAKKHGFPWEDVVARLLEKAPGTLDFDERAFLRAHRDELTDAQVEVYGLEDEEEVVEEKSPERVALEERAATLGVEFTEKTKDAALAKKIEAAEAA